MTIRVSDTGMGIEPEHLPHIFERFYSGRPDASESSGLGLYIARITVEELGGEHSRGIRERTGKRVHGTDSPGGDSPFPMK